MFLRTVVTFTTIADVVTGPTGIVTHNVPKGQLAHQHDDHSSGAGTRFSVSHDP
jgi:hypothetical protein